MRSDAIALHCRATLRKQASDATWPLSIESLEARIVSGLEGKFYGPYTGRCFSNPTDTNIEHIVARSEAHDSGLCAADAQNPSCVHCGPVGGE